ncbi:MAG TPA: SARP family transcriptional regulator, partial [Vulgatibacter sp.]
MSRWLVELSNQPKVRTPAGDRVVLERKTAALLAIVAVDGPTARARLAAHLWPDSDEKKARGNLRQTLSRLRKLVGAELVEAGDPLRLADGVDTDLDELLRGGDLPASRSWSGLLEGLDFTDCDELASWIDSASARLRKALLTRLEAEADRLEQGDRPADAFALAERIA